MDLISSRTAQIIELALDGTAARHKALSANIANAGTENYMRSDVKFEDQLQNALSIEDYKDKIKMANSPLTNGQNAMGLRLNTPVIPDNIYTNAFLKSNSYETFNPESIVDNQSPIISNNNNVNIETEMVELSKNGTKYTILAELEAKAFKKVEDIIKGTSA